MSRVQLVALGIVMLLGIAVAGLISTRIFHPQTSLISNILGPSPTPKPLEAWSIVNLAAYKFEASHLTLYKVYKSTPDFTSYLFSFQTLRKKMTGVITIPVGELAKPAPVIVMIRGYVAPDVYVPGTETRPASEYFASHGFITVAPDFFGYGESDPETTDVWQSRFQKPVSVIELVKTLEAEPITVPALASNSASLTTIPVGKIGLWAHSNGGQITLTSLEVMQKPYPTTLWAPVTAPFPYSLLFFSDEDPDEGKATRKWIAEFEQTYDVFDFSLTDHLDRLQGTFQLHQGTADDSVLKSWSDDFVARIKKENRRRSDLKKQISTSSGTLDNGNLNPIDLTYFTYPDADHNLRPGWQTVVERDVAFFTKNLSN